MKYLLLLIVILLAGCDSEIDSRHVKAGQFLCFDQDGISQIVIDPIGSDLYICQDGSQYVVGYTSKSDENYYYIKHNTQNRKANEMLDRILLPKKWKEEGSKEYSSKPVKPLKDIMAPASTMMEGRGL